MGSRSINRGAALRRAPSILINGHGRPFPRHTPAMAKSASTAAVARDEYSAAGRPCHPGIVTRLVTRTTVNQRARGWLAMATDELSSLVVAGVDVVHQLCKAVHSMGAYKRVINDSSRARRWPCD